ncbi:unnamed protein product, partial [Ectocarpus sp. 6 AP-2014]
VIISFSLPSHPPPHQWHQESPCTPGWAGRQAGAWRGEETTSGGCKQKAGGTRARESSRKATPPVVSHPSHSPAPISNKSVCACIFGSDKGWSGDETWHQRCCGVPLRCE